MEASGVHKVINITVTMEELIDIILALNLRRNEFDRLITEYESLGNLRGIKLSNNISNRISDLMERLSKVKYENGG